MPAKRRAFRKSIASAVASGAVLLTPAALAQPGAEGDQPRTPARSLDQALDRVQGLDADPRRANWGIVTADATEARCGPSGRYYPVALLDEGAFVRIVGTRQNTTIIAYPDGAGALVDARSVRSVSSDGETLTLAEASALRALNATRGLAGSWRSVLGEPLDAGTELEVVEVLTASGTGDEPAAYLVRVPEAAVAYVDSSAIRTATRAEIEGHLADHYGLEPGANGDDGTRADDTEAESEPDTDTEPESESDNEAEADIETEDDASPEQSGDQSSDANGDSDAEPADADPAEPEDGDQTEDEADAEGEADNEAESQTNTPAETGEDPRDDDERADGARTPGGRPVLSAQELTEAFVELRASPEILDDALDELIAEFERTITTLTDERELVGTEARLEWLRLKRDIRDRRNELARARMQAAEQDANTLGDLRALRNAASDYAIVGRLTSSRVYDGVRLPLMYRVVSIDPVRPGDTLGYVRPREGGELRSLLGRIVGASGVTSFDEALRLRIIDGDVVRALPELE